ncbi:MAG TPA: sugar phosphate isomerase/epimerase [Verrucomicrobiae bacterium]|jgi:D-psicose/D-tagatose/L-ribulose 3-epimerase|nr:sugar phosphate isomerase/epimerase [Verrucomicrobiae bacterium]
MRFGINTFLFTASFNHADTRLFPRFKQWGFDSVEIALDNLARLDLEFVKDRLDQHGLVCGSVTPCLGPDKDLRGTLRQQRAGIEFMKRVIDQMPHLACPSLVGVVYSTVGRADHVPRKEYRQQWKAVVRNLKEVSGYASDNGRQISLEPVNRFETDFINTCDQGLAMIHDVGSPALTLHLDTFHMNIEEKNLGVTLRRAGKHLGHFHACGSDRGTPGNDETDWPSIAAALKAIDYQGDVVIESFTSDVKVIARAAAIWRKIEPTREEIAYKGVTFLKKILA